MTDTGIIFDLKKFAIHDGPGIRTTVFFKGCPLDCQWCHNPESRRGGLEAVEICTPRTNPTPGVGEVEGMIGSRVTAADLMAQILQDEIFYDQSGGGVTFSGGEPMLQVDFLSTMLKRCRRVGVHTAVDTSGHAPWEDFEKVIGDVDLILFDLKLMDDIEHIKHVGVSNEQILSNLQNLSRTGKEIIIRLPMIPEVTDTDQNIEAVAAFLDPLPEIRKISLLPYNPFGEDKRERYRLPGHRYHWETQNSEAIAAKKRRLEARGFLVSVGG
jgi:pyruvate formate lyase activating enzyme